MGFDVRHQQAHLGAGRRICAMAQQLFGVLGTNPSTTLDLVLRDLTRDQSFAAALAEIKSAVATGDTRKAYAIRAELLKSYPSLARSKALDKVVLEITRAEKANVKMVQETLTAVRDDLLPSAVSLTARQGPAASGQAGTPVLVAVDGAVNAFDAATGQLLWRRPVGIDLRGTDTRDGP